MNEFIYTCFVFPVQLHLNNIWSDRFAVLSVLSHILYKTLQVCRCIRHFLWS